jgi:hypothetical protein
MSKQGWWWSDLSEVEAYVDVAVMYAVLIGLTLLALAMLLPGLVPR